jgi:hypothetical protein
LNAEKWFAIEISRAVLHAPLVSRVQFTQE